METTTRSGNITLFPTSFDRDFLELDNLIDNHEACDNDFFRATRAAPLRRHELVRFGPEYYHWVKSFPGILAGLIANLRDEEARLFLTEILFSELGSGDSGKMHFKLFSRVLSKLAVPQSEIAAGPRMRETEELVEGMRDLYRSPTLSLALGAQYALEKQAMPMIQNLYAAFKHYAELRERDLEYFTIHLVQEPEHLDCMKKCLLQAVGPGEDFERARAGARACLDLIAAFWARQFKELCNQP